MEEEKRREKSSNHTKFKINLRSQGTFDLIFLRIPKYLAALCANKDSFPGQGAGMTKRCSAVIGGTLGPPLDEVSENVESSWPKQKGFIIINSHKKHVQLGVRSGYPQIIVGIIFSPKYWYELAKSKVILIFFFCSFGSMQPKNKTASTA